MVHDTTSAKLQNWHLLLASSVSKTIASVTTYPHEVIRTRIFTQQQQVSNESIPTSNTQLKYRGVWHSTRIILNEEGWQGLYKGLGTNLLRTVPSTAISLWIYEIMVRHFEE